MKLTASTFTVNLISNSSTETFPDDTLATFSNLLPRVIDLSKSEGLWQVALLEISWPSNVKNVTSGIVELNCAQNEESETDEEEEDEDEAANAGELKAPIEPAIHKEGFVTISRRKRKPISTTRFDVEDPPPKKISIPQGIYQSADQVLEKICERVYNSGKQQTWPIAWSVSRHSQLLRIRPAAAAAKRDRSNEKNQDEEAGFITADTNTSEDESVSNDNDKTIRLVSLDLKNVLGVEDLLPNSTPIFPVDISGGRHTMFVYCDLIQDEILGNTFTSLLRTVALIANTEDEETRKGSIISNHSLSNLQWKTVVKSSFQSISITLRDETGQLMPFLSVGRTCLTLKFRQVQ